MFEPIVIKTILNIQSSSSVTPELGPRRDFHQSQTYWNLQKLPPKLEIYKWEYAKDI